MQVIFSNCHSLKCFDDYRDDVQMSNCMRPSLPLCVFVCMREKEREREGQRQMHLEQFIKCARKLV